jgi:hypothetical protein
MATENPIPNVSSTADTTDAALLVAVAAMPPDQLDGIFANLARLSASLGGENLLVATPDTVPNDRYHSLRIVQTPQATPSWTLTPADFANAYEIALKNNARAILILGQECASLNVTALHDLADGVLSRSIDLALPRYDLPPRAGMANSAILYPFTRALFASRARFPLAIDLGLSLRMAERLASVSNRFSGASQAEALIWPVNEAAMAGFVLGEFDAGERVLPQPADPDINAILSRITGSLFADIDAKAAFWQRTRALPPSRPIVAQRPSTDGLPDIAPMLDAFRLAYTNLREIWSLVLPPNSLLGLKRLSVTDAATFRLPDNLWARIVFDFLLAYRLRTINRGHLLGALIPLYLAWVASHINITASGTNAEHHIEAVAAAFEAEKPYLVSRWRWPDRFNP